MKVIKKRIHCTPINFSSANNLIDVKLNYDNGPELVLEDNSILIFMDPAIYYDVIICNNSSDINVDVLKLKYFNNSDDVADVVYENNEIIEIEEYICKDKYFYRLIV